jgi:NRAMP (natural resistance-associated macrophage protein)-like metal ion transporter
MLEKLKNIGPGAMVAAAFIGPGTVTTATIAGASYGYTLLWAILFSVFATFILQEMASRLGVAGEMGVGEAIRQKIENPILKYLAAFLVISAILVGNAAYEAGNITGAVLGFEPYVQSFEGLPFNPLVLLIGLLAFLLLYSGKYKLIERSLVLMVSIMGFIFLISAILLQPDLGKIVKGIFIPTLPKGALIMVIGLIGTTVVPYNLFLHASMAKKRWTNKEDLSNSRWDTILSVIFGGIITMSILITSAIAFEGLNKTVTSATDLSQQLQPILGASAPLFIAFGFFAAGLSSSITAPLAAAFATSEILGWENNMKNQKFRLIWLVVLLIGLVFSSLGFRPTTVILFAQVANGLLLPIIAIFLLWIMNDAKIMGKYVNSTLVNVLGGLVILITILLGLKGILSATNFL